MSTWSFDLFMDKVTGTHLEKYLFFYIPSTPTNCVKEFTEIYKIQICYTYYGFTSGVYDGWMLRCARGWL